MEAGIEVFFESNAATFALEPVGVERSSLIGTSVVHSAEEMRIDGSLRVGKVCLNAPNLARVANDDGFIDRNFELCTAVAMGNAMPEVKAVADYVTDDVAHDGTVTAMQHFGLI